MESNLDDSELLRCYADEKSEEAFAELVRRHLDLVYSVALRQAGGDTHLAEDVAQVVFTALARKAAALAERPVLGGWLYRTTQFAAIDAVRTDSRRRARETEVNTMQELTQNADAEVDWEKFRPTLDQAIGELKDDDRDAVVLRFFEGKSFADVGARLRLTENAARMRVERALDKLHGLLARRGVTSTAAALGVALANQASVAAPAGLVATVTSAALAGATAAGMGAAGALSFFKFMSTTKIVAGVAGVVALLAVGLAIFEARAVREAEGSLVAVSGERDALRARLAVVNKPARRPGDSPAPVSPAPGEPRPDGSNPADSQFARSMAWQTTSPVDHALDHPEARVAFVQQEVLRAKAKFGRFFKIAGLSTAEEDAFLKQMRDFAEAKLDLTASVRAQGYGPNNPPQDPEAWQRLMKIDAQVDGEFMSKVRALLGDERYKQFVAYRGVIPEVNVADQLAGQLYETDSPLTTQQAVQLVEVLKENRFDKKPAPSPANTLNGTFIPYEAWGNALMQSNLVYGDIMMPAIDWRAPVTDAAIAKAGTVLTPAQLAALRQLQAQQAAQLLLAPPAPRPPGPAGSVRKPAAGDK